MTERTSCSESAPMPSFATIRRRFFFFPKKRPRLVAEAGGDDDLGEDVLDPLGQVGAERLVDDDDAAEGRLPVGRVGVLPRLEQRIAPLATPQGFVCLRMATVGCSNSPIR
jgi:hypothetical protein